MSHLLYLRSLLSVSRHTPISRAAEALHLTQPAVSRHIKVLEGRLGCKLFERLPRGLAATPAANELERQVGSHLDALEAAVGISGGKNEGLAGTIHVGSSSGFTKLLLSGLASLPQYGISPALAVRTPARAGKGVSRPGVRSCCDAGTNSAQGHRLRPAVRGTADARVFA